MEYEIERSKRAPLAGSTLPRFVISSSDLDLVNDRIMPEALQAIVDANEPVTALFGHDTSKPIGKWENFALNDRNELEADLVLVDIPAANEVKALLDANVPLKTSVGFRGTGPKNKAGGRDFTAITLIETSIVVSPANRATRRVKDDSELPPVTRRKFSDIPACDESPDLWRALVPLMKQHSSGMTHDQQIDAVQDLCMQVERAFALENSLAFQKDLNDELALARAKALAEMEDAA